MGGSLCLFCRAARKRLDERLEDPRSPNTVGCNCGWEIETGYAIAYGLAILEAKRLCVLALGIFAEWKVLYFAGGLIPLVLTVVSASFGVPASLGTVFTIHKRRRQPCFPSLKKLLNYLSCLILFCAVLNVIAMASITVYLNTSPESIARIFNTSMILYSDETWHKVTIDDLQFTFQCCGHTEYSDWTAFDWQKVDYASRDEMSNQRAISDERFRPMAVPFTCCNVRTVRPCFHTDLSMNRGNTVNENGCAKILSRVVLSSATITYCVSAFLILTQILLALFIARIAKRPFPSGCPSACECTEKRPSVCPLLESSTSSYTSSNGGGTSSTEVNSSRPKKKRNNRVTVSTINSSRSSSSPSPPPSSNSKKASSKKRPGRTRCPETCGTGAARIRPSLHTEHRVPKKRCCQKRAGLRPNC